MARSIAFALLAIFAVSVALLALLGKRNPNLQLVPELAKSIFQLGVVSIVGACVSLLLFEYQREKQQSDKAREVDRLQSEKQRDLHAKRLEYRESLLLGVLSKALSAYSQAKKARRLLRARALQNREGSAVLLMEGYDAYMELVNDSQLELENLARDVETSKVAFTQPDTLVSRLRKMEVHLSHLMGEYEARRPFFSAAQPYRPLQEQPLLQDFLRSAKESRFMPEVIHPYHEVQDMIRKDLLHPQVPRADAAHVER